MAEECGSDQFNLVSQLSWLGEEWRTWGRVGIPRLDLGEGIVQEVLSD